MALTIPQTTTSARRWLHDSLTYFGRPASILRGYRRADLTADLVAGLTVAVVLLPQAIAYAAIAELPPQMGLYTAIVAAIVGALWGSSAHLQTGPTNATSLLVLATLLAVAVPGTPQYLAAAGLLAVMVGGVKLVMGLAHLGVLVNFVSDSVVIGFTAGAGVLISVNQLRHLLRLDLPTTPSLYETAIATLQHLPETHWPSLLLGLGVVAVMVVIKRFRPRWPSALLGMTAASLVVALCNLDQQGVAVLGELPRRLPHLADLHWDVDLASQMSVGALAVSAIGLMEAMSSARSIAAQSGQRLDSNQEFVGQGLASVATGLFSGYVCSGSFARSAVNHAARARSPLSSVFSGLWVLGALWLFTPLTAYLPRTALAGVLLVAAYGMVNRREMGRIWRASVGDSIIMAATFFATLFLPLEFAVLAGVAVSFLRYIVKTSMPAVYLAVPNENFRHFVRQGQRPACPQLGIVTIGGSLYFGAAHHVEEAIHANLERHPEQRFLLLRMPFVDHCDVSGIHTLEAVVRLYRRHKGDVFVTGVRSAVMERMTSIDFDRFLGRDHFLDREEAVSHLFHKVLDPSICIYECDRRVFAECQALPKYPFGSELPAWETFPEHHVPAWLPSELKARLERGAPGPTVLLVDVREPREYRSGHVPQARLLPLRLIPRQGRTLPRDRPIVLMCRTGRRSRLAACILQDMGYNPVYNLQGGILAWEAAGYPVAVE